VLLSRAEIDAGLLNEIRIRTAQLLESLVIRRLLSENKIIYQIHNGLTPSACKFPSDILLWSWILRLDGIQTTQHIPNSRSGYSDTFG
jgi:hypothetical protein